MLDVLHEISPTVLTGFYVDGRWSTAGADVRSAIVNPASEQVVAEVPLAHASHVMAAIEAARRAFDRGPWPRMSGAERSTRILALADAVAERLPLLGRLWTLQVGMPVALGSRIVQAGVDRLRYYGELAASYAFEEERAGRSGAMCVRREPVGVAALIVPWNAAFPILMQKLGAALAAGCCCIVKPAVESPLEALMLADCLAAVDFPPGVVNVVTADVTESRLLVSSPDVDKISFTGSVSSGRAIASAAAQNLSRVTLELGGKSAAVLLDDVDASKALQVLAPFIMPFSGQFCFSQSRILVPRRRRAELTDLLESMVNGFVLGDPWDAHVQLGPVLSERQRRRVLGYVEGARSDGARVVTGGSASRRFAQGFYVEPTLIDEVTSEMTIAREEVFGPVATVQAFDDDDDAVALANATEMGLSGSVFSEDPERARAVARRIRTGQVGVNRIALDPAAPFGGFKMSGLGREGGVEGLEAFTEVKAMFV